MVVVGREIGDIVLFYAGESLVAQIADWARSQWELALRLAAPSTAAEIGSALTRARAAIIDATEHPGRAMDALQQASDRIAAERVAVYTERPDEGVELFVRLRGVLLLLGPMSRVEWEGFFQPLRDWRTAPRPAYLPEVGRPALLPAMSAAADHHAENRNKDP